MSRLSVRKTILAAAAGVGALALGSAAQAASFTFNPADLVVSVYGGNGVTDNLATAVTLQQLSLSGISKSGVIGSGSTATAAGSMVIAGSNPFSGEYGSSSEGTLQLTGTGHALVIAGYDVNASTYNSNPAGFGGGVKSCIVNASTAATCHPLAQTTLTSTTKNGVTTVTGVQREIAVIGAHGQVNDTTTLGIAYSGNNPRSVASADGTHFYVSGQGSTKGSPEPDQGVFYAQLGAKTATQIDGAYDTRVAQIYKGNLYVSADTTAGSGVYDTIAEYAGLPTTAAKASGKPTVASPTPVTNQSGKFTVTSLSQLNSYDQANLGANAAYKGKIYLSPEQFFFAGDNTLYVADSGNPKGDNNATSGPTSDQGLSDGGLQKWTRSNGVWTLDYTITAGLADLRQDTTVCTNLTDCGTTGLIGLTGKVVGGNVELFATNATIGDLDPTYLYGITDVLSDTTYAQAQNESFQMLYAAAPGANIRGVSFAPVPEPASWAMMIVGLAGVGGMMRRSRKPAAVAV